MFLRSERGDETTTSPSHQPPMEEYRVPVSYGAYRPAPCSAPPPQKKKRPYAFVAHGFMGAKLSSSEHLEKGSKLGMLFIAVTKYLLQRSARDPADGRWRRVKPQASKFNLFLGGACGDGVPFKRLQQRTFQERLVNFYRGFQILCRKSMLVTTLRAHFGALGRPVPSFLPRSFLFYPAKEEQNEWGAFEKAFLERGRAFGGEKNAWILKPSDGSKGKHIVVMNSLAAIKEHIEAQKKGSIAWVVQEYIANPMLLPGRRKFDIRCWVLLDHNYEAWLYREGVLRTTSTAFTLDPAKLSDPFVHLSNHCIQTGHPDYGKYEPTNEMFFAEFREHLDGEYEGRDVLDGVVVPQVRSIVAATMAAAKDQMKNMDGNPYKSFNVFGYDFMVDTDLKVSLIEINSSPAVAGALLPDFTKSLVEKAIDPLFPVPASDADVASAADEKENSDKVAGVGAAGEKEGAGKAAGPSSAGQSSSAWVVCEQCHFGFDVEKST